jgi:quinoprotein glucose dehydrogenase
MTHHDIWDYDLPAAANLVDITVNGRRIKAVAQVTKQGFTFVFDRVTGQPVWPIEERPVPQSDVPGEKPSPTQPFPTKPPPFDRQGFLADDVN